MNFEEKMSIKEIKTITGHEAGVNQIISFDSNEIATCSHDMTIKFWDKKNLAKEYQI